MILRIFAIYDIKTEIFSPPFFQSTTGEALRNFKDLVNDERSTVHKHPEDYRLMCLGNWDNHTGLFDFEQQQSFGFGSDYNELPSNTIPLGLAKP